MSGAGREGVVKSEVVHESRALDPRVHGEAVRVLAAWRELLARLGLLGRDPARYEGAGFGNVSARLGPFGATPRGQRRFLVTATQTGGLRAIGLRDVCVVERWDLDHDRVWSVGPAPPSSESLTHGALYDADPSARVVLHGHSPELWRNARALGVPVTDPAAAYGTPAMAREVQRLHRERGAGAVGVIAMGGHEDGVIAYGTSADAAGAALVRQLARALALESGA
jgi:L-ribulose-5-phosphate 4-epimerase